jgi:hypothetical protein
MLQKCFLPLALLGAIAAVGCGDDETDDSGDGGTVRDGGAGDGGAVVLDGSVDGGGGGTLQSGVYNTSALVEESDGCDLDLLEALALGPTGRFDTHELRNTGTVLSLGRFSDTLPAGVTWTPPGYALGTGTYTTPTTATLTTTTKQRFDEGPAGADAMDCEYDLVRTSAVTYTGVNAISVVFTENNSNFSAGCAPAGYPTMACTSTYRFNLTK